MLRFPWFSRIGLLAVLGTGIVINAQEPVPQEPPPDSGDQYSQAEDPPDEAGPRVARLSFAQGDVSVRRGDSGDSVAGATNAPLMSGDILATGSDARAEVQFDGANRFRLGHDAEARIAEMDQGRYHMELAHGTAAFSVLRDDGGQREVSTPNVSLRPLRPGLYRISVRDDGETAATVRSGEAEIYTERGTQRLSAGQTIYVRGSAQDPEYQIAAAIPPDEWDSWNENRDRLLAQSQSYQHVSRDIYGVEDLDAYGRWDYDPNYGNVWAPNVGPDWAPYSDGRWVWADYYGWSWLDASPWGWAPFHYGYWYRRAAFGWCWYPGPIYRPYFWRPALVAFFGWGRGFGVGFGGWGNVGWVPLAPFERYRPWYGRGWYGGGGYRNINITNVNITNIYRNARTYGGVSGVPANSFGSGQFRNISRVRPEDMRGAGLVRGAMPITPGANNLRYSDRRASTIPRSLNNSRFVSRAGSAGPAGNRVSRVPFEQQRQTIDRSTQRFAANGNRSSGPNRDAAVQSPASRQLGNEPRHFSNQSRQFGNVPRTAEIARNGADNQGWSRFGNPSNNARGRAAGRSNSNSEPPATRSAPSSRDFSWSRFGTPNRGQGSSPGSIDRGSNRLGGNPGSSSRGTVDRGRPDTGSWQRFNHSNDLTPRAADPPGSGNRGGSFGQPRSLQLSPPIVRQRQSDSYRNGFSYPGGGSSGSPYRGQAERSTPSYRQPDRSYRAPSYSQPDRSYSQPRYDRSPSFSAPRNYGGGGGGRGYSAPSYSAPRNYGGGGGRSYSSPSYSAPRSHGGGGGGRSYSAPSSRGGGGGGRSYSGSGGGGGRSSGGSRSESGRHR